MQPAMANLSVLTKAGTGIFKETLQIPVLPAVINDSKWSLDTVQRHQSDSGPQQLSNDENQPTEKSDADIMKLLTGADMNMKPTVEIGLPPSNLHNFGVSFPQSFNQPQTIPASVFGLQKQITINVPITISESSL